MKPLAIKIRHEYELRRGVNSTFLNMTDFGRNNTKIQTKSDNVFSSSHFCDITSETEAGVPGLAVSRNSRGNPAQETRALMIFVMHSVNRLFFNTVIQYEVDQSTVM